MQKGCFLFYFYLFVSELCLFGFCCCCYFEIKGAKVLTVKKKLLTGVCIRFLYVCMYAHTHRPLVPSLTFFMSEIQ